MDKIERNRQIRELRAGGMIYRRIGDIFGMSRQAVNMVCLQYHKPKPRLPTVGKIMWNGVEKTILRRY